MKIIDTSPGTFYNTFRLHHLAVAGDKLKKTISQVLKLTLFISLIITILYATAGADERQKLAVADLNAQGVSSLEASQISDFLREAVSKTNLFILLARSNMDEILTEQKVQLTGCIESECAVWVGKILAVKKLIVGSVGKIGAEYYIQIKLIDVETGEMEWTEKVYFKKISGSEIDLATQDITERLVKWTQAKAKSRAKKSELKIDGGRSKETEQTAVIKADINLISVPAGAKVYFDVNDKGKTPLMLRGVEEGEHQILYKLEGYVDRVEKVIITSGDTKEIKAELERQRGNLIIKSVPDDSEVYIDGEYKGKTGIDGLRIEGMVVGEYEITLKKPKYKDLTERHKVLYLATEEINMELTPKPGKLLISSTPDKADVYIDGEKKGVSVLTLDEISAGNHKVLLKKEGYEDYEVNIFIESEKAQMITGNLKEIKKFLWEEAPIIANDGDIVQVQYKGTFDNGTLFDQTDPDTPFEFTIGSKEIITGFSKAVIGMRVNEEKTMRITMEEAYGIRDESLVRSFPVNALPKNMKIEKGMTIGLQDQSGKQIPGIVVEASDSVITVDMNHPLANYALNFTIKLIAIKLISMQTPAPPPENLEYYDSMDVVPLPNSDENASNIIANIQFQEPEMVLIPAGEFEMGSNDEGDDEKPIHKVYLDEYYIGKYEVTFDEYDYYCKETGKDKPSDEGWGRGNRPVINVSWLDATAYCEWLSKKTSKKYHIPTEAEWEKAARGGLKNTQYPWGNDQPDRTKENYASKIGKTTEVGTYPANDYKLYDIAGNVQEWCNDWYAADYYINSPNKNPQGPLLGSSKVIRGGNWLLSASGSLQRCASRDSYAHMDSTLILGFRVAMTP